MAVGFSNTNKPLNPRGNDASPKGYNRAALYSGKALDFDGVNDVVNITTSDLDFGANDFSVSAIVDWSESHTDGKLAYAERGSSSSQLAAWQIRTDGRAGNMLFQANTVADGWQAVYFFGVEAIIADTLTHLTFVRVGTGVTLYINGVFYSTGTGSLQATLDTPNGAFAIGNRIGANNYWNGLVSNFKVFSGALTAAQVADLYNNPEKVVPTGVDNTALKLWLPMQEGAGTTAYDGSGNGNHGTISGATYVHGIGAPVAQTAVIDWNKGSNVINKSEQFLASYYANQNIQVINDAITAPDGDNNGYKFVASNANTFHLCNQSAGVSSGVYTQSVFAKAGEYEHIYLVLRTDGGAKRYGVKFDLSDGTFTDDISYNSPTNTGYAISDAGNGWYRCSVTSTHSSGQIVVVFGPSVGGNLGDVNNIFQGDGTSGIYAWGLQAEIAPSVGAYIPNPSDTRITSPVLLPQGLTSGRDITGVNLFENVRKQGALNLDGNSWAEVHDNASVDLTDGITLESWVYWNGESGYFGFIGKWINTANRCYLMATEPGNLIAFYISKNGSALVQNSYTLSATGWYHFVGTEDGTNLKLYVDGVLVDTETSISGNIFDSDYNVEIGRYNNSTSQEYTNQIAQPRIYNRALTAAEVLQNYNSGKNTYK